MATETPYTGLTASIKIGSTPTVLGYVSGFDLNLDKTIIEILAFGMDYKEKVPAIKDWSASVNGTVAFVAGGSQETLMDAFEEDTELTFGVYLSDTVYFTGSGYVSKVHIAGAPDGAITLDCDVAGNGAIVLTIPAGT